MQIILVIATVATSHFGGSIARRGSAADAVRAGAVTFLPASAAVVDIVPHCIDLAAIEFIIIGIAVANGAGRTGGDVKLIRIEAKIAAGNTILACLIWRADTV